MRGARPRLRGAVPRPRARRLQHLAFPRCGRPALARGAANELPERTEPLARGQSGDGDLVPLLTRRGFTLSELMVSLLLLGIVAAAIYAALATNQRIYFVTGQRIDLQQNLRAAASILPAELRELDAADSDLVAMSDTSLTIDRKSVV